MSTAAPPELPEVAYIKNLLPSRYKVIITILLLIVMAFGYQLASDWIIERKLNVYMLVAKRGRQNQDIRQEYEALQAAIRLRSTHLPAVRKMAKLAERLKVPEALDYHARLVYLEPQREDYLKTLFKSCFIWKRTDVGLAGFNRSENHYLDHAAFYSQRGLLYLASGKVKAALVDLEKASALDPDNPAFHLNLLRLKMLSFDIKESEYAIRDILKLPVDYGLDGQVLKVQAALISEDSAQIVAAASYLLDHEKASLDQKLKGLEALYQVAPKHYRLWATQLQQSISGVIETYEVAKAFNHLGDWQRTLAWSQQWPVEEKVQYPLNIILADAYMQGHQLRALEEWLQTGDWELASPIDALLISGASLNKGGPDPFEVWLLNESYRDEVLFRLARLAQHWSFEKQHLQILDKIIERRIFPVGALKQKYTYLRGKKDTIGMLQTMLQAGRFSEDDEVVSNNMAYLALLLDQQKLGAQKIARENYKLYPERPAMVSTWSLALYRQGEIREAQAVFNTLPESYLEKAPKVVSLLGALYLIESGDKDEALKWKKQVKRADVLPEEWELLQSVMPLSKSS